jgi:hypothetical protein
LSNSLTVTIGSEPSVMVNVSTGTSRTMKIFRAHDAARYLAILAVAGGYVLEHKRRSPLPVHERATLGISSRAGKTQGIGTS